MGPLRCMHMGPQGNAAGRLAVAAHCGCCMCVGRLAMAGHFGCRICVGRRGSAAEQLAAAGPLRSCAWRWCSCCSGLSARCRQALQRGALGALAKGTAQGKGKS